MVLEVLVTQTVALFQGLSARLHIGFVKESAGSH